MSTSIKQSVVSAVKWNAVGQFGRQGITFFVSIILARILLPEQFGLIGMLLFFTGIADVFINSGLGVALIQKKTRTDLDYSTVFYFNIVVSLFFYALLFVAAPYIASFYEQPMLLNLTRVIASIFVINALGTVQMTILTINLEFKVQNLISLVGVVVSSLVAVVMAYRNYGVYSLVGQTLSYSLITNLLYWFNSKWKPTLSFSIESFRSLFQFASKILISSVLEKIFTTVDSLLIGKVFNAAQLGLYTRAKSTRDLPVVNATGIISSVFFPVFSRIEDEKELKRYHLKFLSLIAYVIFPLMAGLFVVAEPFTISLFSEKWLESVPMLQILCIYGPVYPLSVILVQSILIKGRTSKFLQLDIYKKIILVTGMIIGVYLGVYAFMWALCICNFACFYLNLHFTAKVMNIKMTEYLNCFWRALLISIIMASVVYFIGAVLFFSAEIELAIQCAAGFLVYWGLSRMFRLEDYIFFKDMLQKKFKL